MPDVSIALSAKDKVSSILKKVGQISGETADEIDKLQDSLDTLSSAKVDLKTNLDKVRQQVSEARKEFRKLGDSVSEQNYKDKLSELEKLEQQYYAVSKSIRMVENEETSLAGTRSKLSNREAGGSSGSSPPGRCWRPEEKEICWPSPGVRPPFAATPPFWPEHWREHMALSLPTAGLCWTR